MYSGQIIDDLIHMVERAESRASREIVVSAQPAVRADVYTPRYLFEPPAQQPALIGVA